MADRDAVSERFFFCYPEGAAAGSGKEAAILFHARDPRWLVGNATTVEIARLLAGSGGKEGAVQALTDKYGIPRGRAARDVELVGRELGRQRMLGPKPPTPVRRSPVLGSAFLHLTSRCNLSCRHCYASGEGRSGELSRRLVLRLIDELADRGARGVTFSGGEPLLHPDFEEILHRAGRRMPVRLLTNGTLIDDRLAAQLAALDVRVQISIDGADDGTHDLVRGRGSFAAALRAIELLQEAGIAERINFSTTITRLNLHQLARIITLAESRGVPLVRFLPLARRGRAAAEWGTLGASVAVADHEAFYEHTARLRRDGRCRTEVSCGLSGFLLQLPEDEGGDGIWCSVGRTVVVDTDGSLYPCVLLMDERFKLGQAADQGLAAAVDSPVQEEVCRQMVERRTRIAGCAACSWRNLCQAGCMGLALDQRGSIWRRDHFCAYRKMAYKRAFDDILREQR